MNIVTSWDILKSNWMEINSTTIPRFVQTTSTANIQIHGFANASMRACGCICQKCRAWKIYCLKTKSLPRLELWIAHQWASCGLILSLLCSYLRVPACDLCTSTRLMLFFNILTLYIFAVSFYRLTFEAFHVAPRHMKAIEHRC